MDCEFILKMYCICIISLFKIDPNVVPILNTVYIFSPLEINYNNVIILGSNLVTGLFICVTT